MLEAASSINALSLNRYNIAKTATIVVNKPPTYERASKIL